MCHTAQPDTVFLFREREKKKKEKGKGEGEREKEKGKGNLAAQEGRSGKGNFLPAFLPPLERPPSLVFLLFQTESHYVALELLYHQAELTQIYLAWAGMKGVSPFEKG